ncbi:MAG: helix-turn-helix domain-containing protein [Pseudomonadota bacterium]
MKHNDPFEHHAQLLRAGNALGKPGMLLKLFEFLLAGARAGTAPKEIEIAVAVFNKDPNFDLSQDAAVRVYIHRLRKKLDEFYAGAGKEEPERLAIPKGEYRLVVEAVAAAAPPAPEPAYEPAFAPAPERAPERRTGRTWPQPRTWLLLGAAAALLNGMAWWGVSRQYKPDDDFTALRHSAPWSALLNNGRTTVVAVGDYYIFGEIDRSKGTDRLVREYAINSHDDLSEHVMRHPELIGKYQDLHLSYLPIAVPYVLRDLLPLLAPTAKERERVRVVMASNLTPGMLKQANIVYVGYLSGLGILREPVFAASRFRIGETFDELIDAGGQRRYVSQQGGPDNTAGKSRDYGYFSTFEGPDGNRIVIVSGMRDIGVMQTAEATANRATLETLLRKAGPTAAFEALYEVDGIKRLNIGGNLLLASPLKEEKIWKAYR